MSDSHDSSASHQVYPRPRGGANVHDGDRIMPDRQVYPRPRGGAGPPPCRLLASIAGEPWFMGVYPRPRGGAADQRIGIPFGSRSIPAHAGEPIPRKLLLSAGEPRSARRAVYPRPRGGASCGYPM